MTRIATVRSLGALLALLLLPWAAQAQPVINGFEYMAEDTTDFEYVWTGQGSAADQAFLNLSDYTDDVVEGETALKADWQIYTAETWGGFIQIVRQIPDSVGTFIDLSDFTHITFWYNNLEKPQLSNGDPAPMVESRLLLFDSSEGGRAEDTREVWYSQTSSILSSEPGWQQFSMPLDCPETGCAGAPVLDEGFTLPGWSGAGGNDRLDLDMVTGYAIEWTSTPIGGDSTAHGVLVLDKMQPTGVRYNLLESFDAFAERADVEQDATGGGGLTLATRDTEPFEGQGTLEVDWTVDANEGWGGFANFFVNLPEGEFYEDMTERTHLSLYYNVVEPASQSEHYTFRFKLHDTSEGVQENWYFETDVLLDTTAGWHRLLMPLRQLQGDPSSEGFTIAPWEAERGNETLNLDKISGFSVDFVGLEGASGTQSSGTVLFDRLTGYGFQSSDNTAPVAVQGFSATPGQYSNILTWEDVPDETAETYDVYYSFEPITGLDDLDRFDVEVAAQDVERGTQVWTHPLFAPQTDQEVTYYYAVTATDEWGNTSEVTALDGPVTNTARGKVTLTMQDLAGTFAADGELDEWQGITPIRLAPSEGAKILANTAVDNDQDLAVDVYLAFGEDALYVAYDVVDDFVEPTGAANPWENDGTELYIGLYDHHGAPHNSYQRGAEPDYKFVFYGDMVNLDIAGGGTLYTTDDDNYSFTETFPSGYVIEAKLPYDTFAFDEDADFVPENGMRIPLDLVIQDQDNGTREGIMVYSRDNDDNSWASPSNWAYTWIGDRFFTETDVEEGGVAPQRFGLDVNYPNPFRGRTQIHYALDAPAEVSLDVFNVLGQRVATLVDGQKRAAGTYAVTFDAADVAPGVYLYRLRAGERTVTRKMIVLR